MDGSADALGVVPAHTYARLRFDEAAEQAVQHLGYVLQMHQGSPYQGQFVAQSEQRAGASPRSFPGPDGRENPRGLPGDEHSRVGMRRFGRTNHPPVGPFASIVSPELLVSPSEAFANVLSGSPALRARHARAISPGSRARADRPLSPAHSRSPISSFRRDGVLSPAHRAPLGAAGHGDDWKADHGRAEPPGHAIRTGSREAAAAVQVRPRPARRISRLARSKENFPRCWFFRGSSHSFFFFSRIRGSDGRDFLSRRSLTSFTSPCLSRCREM